MRESIDTTTTSRTRRRYDRIARIYDLAEAIPETMFRRMRRRLWSQVRGTRVLEVGVGTGKNIPYYPAGLDVTAIDLSPRMLERAKRRATLLGSDVTLALADVQDLEFADCSFDEVVASFVFCSVPDSVLGLTNVRRVLKSGGQLSLLEHVRASNRMAGWMMDTVNPLCVRLSGANINRRTVLNVEAAGFSLELVEDLGTAGIIKLIRARRA